ncbi:hypothetical protein PPACK8108_LOCUS840 [Phakopsora pachyrhizi]|uniref:CCHC-type domain-containing protein n=1 Tax=Phakopsora pachyrhizi TaxID=170000 RepID=A0AAV0AGV2_PHAPC|nr:hypothetical protein PPACK8108_LOCUS840 [Phakopsora pachyrhizi]
MKCYNCVIDGHSAKLCCKEWRNYKFAPPKANVGETANNNTVAFVGIVSPCWESNATTDELSGEELVFFEPENGTEGIGKEYQNRIPTELEIFGNLGELETQAYKGNIICAMTGTIVGDSASIGKANSILLDLGASDCMFVDKSDFHNYQAMDGKVGIGEVGRSVDIVGKGDVKMCTNRKENR